MNHLINSLHLLIVLTIFLFINKQFTLARSVNQQFSGLRRAGRQLISEYVERQISSIDLIPCASVCVSTKSCRTFSWNQREKKCLLSSRDVTHDNYADEDLLEDASWKTMSLLEYTVFGARDLNQLINMTFNQAKDLCITRHTVIASRSDLLYSNSLGFHYKRCCYLSDGSVGFVIQGYSRIIFCPYPNPYAWVLCILN